MVWSLARGIWIVSLAVWWRHCCALFVVCWWPPSPKGGWFSFLLCNCFMCFISEYSGLDWLDSIVVLCHILIISQHPSWLSHAGPQEVKWSLTLSKSDIFCVGLFSFDTVYFQNPTVCCGQDRIKKSLRCLVEPLPIVTDHSQQDERLEKDSGHLGNARDWQLPPLLRVWC